MASAEYFTNWAIVLAQTQQSIVTRYHTSGVLTAVLKKRESVKYGLINHGRGDDTNDTTHVNYLVF
jgi:hypothetical protein